MTPVSPKESGLSAGAGEGTTVCRRPEFPPSVRRRISVPLVLGLAVWLSVVVGAMTAIIDYTNAPGPSGSAPAQWPAQSQIRLDAALPTLVLFAHPHCPCTRATMGELNLLMARCQGRVRAHVVFIKPDGTSEDWTQTDLWRAASAIPGVTVRRDDNGVEAARFHAETSGQTVLYDPAGRRLFQGGITISRGHSGDNPGRSALVALLEGRSTAEARTPVFGCSLSDKQCQQEAAACKP